ncbi:FAD:protein FMN transferase [Thioclava sp. SK-1]|uniref:FAD:protein FMN transferase n=1 Tax=Thioclava sp. SK-1 TaxID=1889770 RepID=UPI000825D33D|nr:FAD:protein FMN transferase [Thioclava sp. SK-1]
MTAPTRYRAAGLSPCDATTFSAAHAAPLVLIDPSIPRDMAQSGMTRATARGQTMGSFWRVHVWGAPYLPDPAPIVAQACHDTIALFSPWRRDSALSRFNHAARGWHQVPGDVLALLRRAIAICDASQGRFDPSLGRLNDLWGFGPSGRVTHPPARGALAQARAASGRHQLRIRDDGCLWQPGGLWLDFGGMAKGWAVDRASAMLTAAGLHVHLITIGGEVAAHGLSPEAQPWWIALDAPPGADMTAMRVGLHHGALAGSGDWVRRCGPLDGGWSHTLDPDTGRPCTGAVTAVHVAHPNAALADAWASALMAMPADTVLRAAADNDLSAVILMRQPGGDVTRHLIGLDAWQEDSGWIC